jgi:hypothetical protein
MRFPLCSPPSLARRSLAKAFGVVSDAGGCSRLSTLNDQPSTSAILASGIASQKSTKLLSRVAKRKQLANVPKLDELIREVRGQKVMLDFDLARVYGVETKSLNRAVKRNAPLPQRFHVSNLRG